MAPSSAASKSPYPPVPLVLRMVSSIAGSGVVTKRWLVIKHCTSPFPTINPMLEVEAAICAYSHHIRVRLINVFYVLGHSDKTVRAFLVANATSTIYFRMHTGLVLSNILLSPSALAYVRALVKKIETRPHPAMDFFVFVPRLGGAGGGGGVRRGLSAVCRLPVYTKLNDPSVIRITLHVKHLRFLYFSVKHKSIIASHCRRFFILHAPFFSKRVQKYHNGLVELKMQ